MKQSVVYIGIDVAKAHPGCGLGGSHSSFCERSKRPRGLGQLDQRKFQRCRGAINLWREWGSVLTFDTGDARTSPGQLLQDFAKFFSGRCHVTLCSVGDADEVKR